MAVTRRKLILGGVAVGAVGAVVGLKPSDAGKSHNDYFTTLGDALKKAKISKPTLVIDRQAMLANVKTLRSHIQPNHNYRIVAKSLPSTPMLKELMVAADTNRLMVFHRPFLNQVMKEIPEADILLGKPMPIQAAENFYTEYGAGAETTSERLQWLVDSKDRLVQYQALAGKLSIPMRINIELDVGLHRGGVVENQELEAMLGIIEVDKNLSFSGFMGYEPHLGEVPGDPLTHRDEAMAIYQDKVNVAEKVLGRSISELTLNCAGSPTYQYYEKGDFPHNELSAGSCLVKPTNFDRDSLADHVAASYIATPVIKSMDTVLPGAAWLSKLMSLWDPNRKHTFFTYGGYWKAKPVSPEGLRTNPLFGRSTNQEMYNGSESIELGVDDYVFFRPTQSEFVFLQFGDIVIYDGNEVAGTWPVLG